MFDKYSDSRLFRNNLNLTGNVLKLIPNEDIYIVTASPSHYVKKYFSGIAVFGGELVFNEMDYCCGYVNCYGKNKS